MRNGKRWLLAGALAAGALFALPVFGDEAWIAGYPRVADAIGVSRLALCWFCFVPAWKSLGEAPDPLWGRLGRAALAAALVGAVLT